MARRRRVSTFPWPTRCSIAADLRRDSALTISRVAIRAPIQTDTRFLCRPAAAFEHGDVYGVRDDQTGRPLDLQRCRFSGNHALNNPVAAVPVSSPRPGTITSALPLARPTRKTWKACASRSKHLVADGREAMIDCEHFFDGYKGKPRLCPERCAKTAYEAGARWVVLCDTNGGTLPHEVAAIVADVIRHWCRAPTSVFMRTMTPRTRCANTLAAVQCRGASDPGYNERDRRTVWQCQPDLGYSNIAAQESTFADRFDHRRSHRTG